MAEEFFIPDNTSEVVSETILPNITTYSFVSIEVSNITDEDLQPASFTLSDLSNMTVGNLINNTNAIDLQTLMDHIQKLMKNGTENDAGSFLNSYWEYMSEKKTKVDLNYEYKHGSGWTTCSYLVLVTFIFYVPRMLYYRVSRSSVDGQLPGYFILCFLSLIASSGGIIHFVQFQQFVTGNSDFNSTNFEEQVFNTFILKSLTSSINRVVSPIIAVLCLQQIATHSHFVIPILQETVVHLIMCVTITVAVFSYSFLREYFVMSSLEPTSPMYPDPIHVDLYDLIVPLITAVLFLFARKNLSRQSVYTTEKCGPNGPTTLDRVSKAVVFQTVMVFIAFGAIAISPSEENEVCGDKDGFYASYFFMTAQTPVVHWCLFRSLLRSRKPTRLCFLMCCSNEEKVGVLNTDVEMGEQQNNAKNKVTEEEEEEEEEEPETLDPNKIVILSASQVEERNKKEENDVQGERRNGENENDGINTTN